MYPVLFRVADFEVTSFGMLVAIAALVGLWIFHRQLRRSGLPADALDVAIAGLASGLAGAKLAWVLEHLGEERVVDLLLSRGGMSWFGGFLGGILAGVGMMYRKRLPKIAVLATATPALAFGHLIGRIGCFLVGDDYGRASDLPWAVAFPQGLPPTNVPVHPAQLYEALGLGLLGSALLRWRRQGAGDFVVLGRYLVVAGALRFGIEFIRVNTRVLWGLSVAHLVSFGLIVVGVGMLSVSRSRASAADARPPDA